MTTEPKKPVSYYLTDSDRERLREMAQAQDRSMSWTLAAMIREVHAEWRKGRKAGKGAGE